jgi:hypothetical protein
MSSTLYWVPTPRDRKPLPDRLKHALQKRYSSPLHTKITGAECDYLEGLRDAGIDGAEELLEAVLQHGEIELSEVY